jgi:glycosyltransferase involved in cell wall biosynthesis
VGGIGTFTNNAARLLAAHNHQVVVITGGPTNQITRQGDIEVHHVAILPYRFPFLSWLYLYRLLYRTWLPSYLEAVTWARTVSQYLLSNYKAHYFDIIDAPETMGESGLIPGGFSKNICCRIHSSPHIKADGFLLEKFLIRRFELKACNRARTLISPSKYVSEHYAKKELGISNIKICHNPFIPWDQPVSFDKKTITNLLFVGRIEYIKGINVLLKAFRIIKDIPNVNLRIIGSIPPPIGKKDITTQIALQQVIDEFKDSGSPIFEYAGSRNHSQLWEEYDKAGIVIMPSLAENYPYTALEAVSRGCYVVASNIGGLPEIINSKEKGLLFTAGDALELVDRLKYCFENSREIASFVEQSVQKVQEEYSLSRNYQSLLASYDL